MKFPTVSAMTNSLAMPRDALRAGLRSQELRKAKRCHAERTREASASCGKERRSFGVPQDDNSRVCGFLDTCFTQAKAAPAIAGGERRGERLVPAAVE